MRSDLSRIRSNMTVVSEEMAERNSDVGWQMAVREVIDLLDRLVMREKIESDPDLEFEVRNVGH